MAHSTVVAPDGVELAVWEDGHGPALVMVHGSIADHTTFNSFIDVLRHRFTTFALDRRGFGASRDGDLYEIGHDFSDVAAVVDWVSSEVGGPVILWGHSYGANCAMGGAALTDQISHLVLYEPSLGMHYPPGSIGRVEAHIAAGAREAAIEVVLAEVLKLTKIEIAAFRMSPLWPTRVAVAGTIPRECRVEEGWVFRAGQFDAIAARTVVLSGSESVPEVLLATTRARAAIPGAEIKVMAGHAHFAHRADPQMVSDLIADFAGVA